VLIQGAGRQAPSPGNHRPCPIPTATPPRRGCTETQTLHLISRLTFSHLTPPKVERKSHLVSNHPASILICPVGPVLALGC